MEAVAEFELQAKEKDNIVLWDFLSWLGKTLPVGVLETAGLG